MKHLKFIWAFIGLIAILYIAILLFIRLKSPNNTEYKIYNSWRENYVIQKNKHESFVNTSNKKSHPVALSEGQGYGLYLTAKAGTKGWAKQKEYDNLLNYYLAHREYLGVKHNQSTYLMQWRQYQKNKKWSSDANSATDGDLFIAFSLTQSKKAWPKRAKFYQKVEHKLANDILTYEYNKETKTLTVGDWATKNHLIII
ncbi:glycosyl hydrolase family 8 [Bombilactobacillus apium]|uniref:glycosyl hydrolase family 8 n=1 Tax=Bombilactobacillus apium TaxID=2675299 RepID=UPI001E3BD438|nr:glycosyl hydrolase family 8 [Bombilactobacillus apium]